jgi:hypothetical protein
MRATKQQKDNARMMTLRSVLASLIDAGIASESEVLQAMLDILPPAEQFPDMSITEVECRNALRMFISKAISMLREEDALHKKKRK